jgi:hypothetical protein
MSEKARCRTCRHKTSKSKAGETVWKWCEQIARWVHPRGSCPYHQPREPKEQEHGK